MKKEISEALMEFYNQVLEPEIVSIKKVQSDHSERFIDAIGHFDSVYKRFDRLEDEYHAFTYGLKKSRSNSTQIGRSAASLKVDFWN